MHRRSARKVKKTTDLAALQAVTGRWKISGAVYDCGDIQPVPVCDSELVGVEVILDDQCDVTWVVPAGVEPNPLLQTTSFAVDRGDLDLVGGPGGREFNFLWDQDEDDLELTRDLPTGDTVTIRLTKVKDVPEPLVGGFSLRDALEEGFFSDLSLRSADGQTFPCHRIVLASCSSGVSYREWEIFLSSLRSALLRAALSYVYSSELPADLTVPLAKELLSATQANPKLSDLSSICRSFIDAHDLKLRLMQLVDEILSGMERGKKLVESTDMTNPAKVLYAGKQIAREAVSIACNFCLLSELYSRNKGDMSKAEKQEVLEYCRGRVVVIIDLAKELLELVMAKFNSLTEIQVTELAQYILPEVERYWDMLLASCKDIKSALSSKTDKPLTPLASLQRGDITLTMVLHLMNKAKEVNRMQKMAKEFEEFVPIAEQKREAWRDAGEDERTQIVLRAFEKLLGEAESQVENLDKLKAEILIKNALDWKRFKMLVAIICSSVSWGLRKVVTLKAPLKPVLMKACKFVHNREVFQALAYLAILDEADLAALTEDGEQPPESPKALPQLEHKFPPPSDETPLAKGCQKLLESHELSDMYFVLPDSGPEGEVVLPAHRVIVAARCEWVKKALTSGMREAIDRRITVQDVDPESFRVFLQYLYGISLKLASVQVEELVDLLAIADRFEASALCLQCESELVGRIESSNVFLLLQVADRYSAHKLREATLQYIIQSPEVIMSEMESYSGIAEELRQEIRTLLSGTQDPSLQLRHMISNPHKSPGPARGSPRQALSPSDNSTHSEDGSSDGEEYALHEDTVTFDKAVAELRAVVGAEAPEEMLKDLLLAADCDVNRALNFYFGTQ